MQPIYADVPVGQFLQLFLEIWEKGIEAFSTGETGPLATHRVSSSFDLGEQGGWNASRDTFLDHSMKMVERGYLRQFSFILWRNQWAGEREEGMGTEGSARYCWPPGCLTHSEGPAQPEPH